MTLNRLIFLIRQHLLVLGTCTLLGLVAAVGLTAKTPSTYSSEVALLESSTITDSAGSDLFNSAQYMQAQMPSYVQLVTTATVLDPVIKALGLHETSATLAQHITAEVPLNTLILRVTVKDRDPTRAAAIANKVAASLQSAVATFGKPDELGSAPSRLTVVQPAMASPTRVSPSLKLNVIAGLVVGLGIGILIAGIVTALRQRLTSAVEFEEATGLPVLGILPSDAGIDRPDGKNTARLIWSSIVNSVGPAPRCLLIAQLAEAPDRSKLAARMSAVVAESDRSVAWMDIDLLGGRVTDALGVPKSPGLSDLLGTGFGLDEVVVPWRDTSLAVVPSGTPVEEASQHLNSHALAEVIASLREGFETTVIDATSATDLAEIAVPAALADGVVLVVTPQVRQTDVIQTTRELLAAQLRVVGLLIDGVDERDRVDFERRLVPGSLIGDD